MTRVRILGGFASLALAAVFVGFAAFTAASERRLDYVGYFAAGRAVVSGSDPYDSAEAKEGWPAGNVYPPAFTLAVVPISLVDTASPPVARAAWQAGNLLALWWALSLVAGLVHGRRLTLGPRGEGMLPASPLLLVPLALAYEPVTGSFLNGNVSLILFAWTLQGLAWQARGRPLLGGLALGSAAALKVMPIVFLPYLAWRGRWREAGWMLAAFLVVSLAPIAVFGGDAYAGHVRAWWRAIGEGWGSGWLNQSVPATWDRFLGHGVVPFLTSTSTPLAASGEASVRVAVWATRAAVLGLALRLFRGPARADGRVALTEWSAVFIVGAIMGPLTWKHYLAVLLLPYALLASLLLDPRCSRAVRRASAGLLLMVFLLTVATSRDLVGRGPAAHFQLAGVYAAASVGLLLGLFWLRRRLETEPEDPPPADSEPRAAPSAAAAGAAR